MINSSQLKTYKLTNKNGVEAVFTNYGQRLMSLKVPDVNGNFDDVVLGYSNPLDYLTSNEMYYGAIVGRYCNRIANGIFKINNCEYKLVTNDGNNHIHGGLKGFNSVIWTSKSKTKNKISFTRVSPDMEEGYPGNLEVTVDYLLTNDNELIISYHAETDKSTPVNLTHHSYFNLTGEGNCTIDEHLLMINADTYTKSNKESIPTGELTDVEDTPFDFRELKAMGKDIDAKHEQIVNRYGYDHNFILNKSPKNSQGLTFAALVVEPKTKRKLEVFTSEPGMHFYSSNYLNGKDIGKSGRPYLKRGAFCLETQHFPDSPNKPNFPTTILEPGKVYKTTTVYEFGIETI